jgi:hypothetical protein
MHFAWWSQEAIELTTRERNLCRPLNDSPFGDGILRGLLPQRFASETDFCSFAVLIASQKEASI